MQNKKRKLEHYNEDNSVFQSLNKKKYMKMKGNHNIKLKEATLKLKNSTKSSNMERENHV